MNDRHTRPWRVKFAPHIGFPTSQDAYFAHSAVSLDPLDQVKRCSELGFAGIALSNLVSYDIGDQRRIGDALREESLELGAVSVCPSETRRIPLFCLEGADPICEIRRVLSVAMDATQRGGGHLLSLIIARDPGLPHVVQIHNVVENLKRVAPLLEKRGITLCLEVTSESRAPGLLINRTSDGYAIIGLTGSPAIKLLLDVVHLALGEGNVGAQLSWCARFTASIQLGDLPGRLEPGSGELNWPFLIRAALEAGYGGMFELEHLFSKPGREGEEIALSRLQVIDQAISKSGPFSVLQGNG
jgi:hydroxypyruvate isomerase